MLPGLVSIGVGECGRSPHSIPLRECADQGSEEVQNDDTLSAEDLALGYKQLLRVEEAWRSLKSGLGLRPVYHWRLWRIEAHAGLCVLALLLERVVELRVGQTWRTVRHCLQQVKVVTYEREGVEVRQTTEPDEEAAKILKTLKSPPRPGTTRLPLGNRHLRRRRGGGSLSPRGRRLRARLPVRRAPQHLPGPAAAPGQGRYTPFRVDRAPGSPRGATARHRNARDETMTPDRGRSPRAQRSGQGAGTSVDRAEQ